MKIVAFSDKSQEWLKSATQVGTEYLRSVRVTQCAVPGTDGFKSLVLFWFFCLF